MTNSLTRNEILRGFGIFEEILEDSSKFAYNSLVAYVNIQGNTAGLPVKVGFLLSKKKLKMLPAGIEFAVYLGNLTV